MNSQERFDELLVELAAIEKDVPGILTRLNSPATTMALEHAAHAVLAAIRKHPTAPVIHRRPEYRDNHEHLTGMA